MGADILVSSSNNNHAGPLVLSSNDEQAFLDDQVPRRGRFTDWIGRVVSHCPGGRYTNSTNLKVCFVLGVTGIVSIGTLMIGGIWKDSLDDNQKFIVTSVGFVGSFGSMIGYAVNSVIYKNQP